MSKRRTEPRSGCPINACLEMIGDTWSLLILRDVIYFGKRTYNEFLSSDEGIARNILADRLIQLQAKGLLAKRPHPEDRRKEIYEATQDGLDLVPLLLELAEWGAKRVNQEGLPHEWLQTVREQRATIVPRIQEAVRQGRSIFGSRNSLFEEVRNAGEDTGSA